MPIGKKSPKKRYTLKRTSQRNKRKNSLSPLVASPWTPSLTKKKGGGVDSFSTQTGMGSPPPKKYSSIKVCSPANRKNYNSANTCYDAESLQDIAVAWNQTHPDNLIKIKQQKKRLYSDIKSKIKECNNEWCWLDQPFINRLRTDRNLRDNFKPPIPKGKWQWLTTDDIELVCKQYEQVVPTFKFLGAYPIDFTRIYHYIFGEFSVSDYLSQGYKKIGIVFNEDPHDKPGSHWIGLFLDLPKRTAYFFDSYGDPPHRRVALWVNSLQPTFKLKYNRTRHQLLNSECGMYTIHFIVRMALGVSFRKIEEDTIRDARINKKRLEYFNRFKTVEPYW